MRDEKHHLGTKYKHKGRRNKKNSIFADLFLIEMLHKNIPGYLITKDNIIFHLILVFVYSLLFVNLFTPFQGAWYNVQHYTRGQLFADTLIIVTGGSIVLMFSRMLMYRSHNQKPLSQLQYWSWHIVEVFAIAILYTLIVRYIVHDEREFSEIFARAVIFVPTILVIPTVISLLYFSTKAKDKRIKELETRNIESAPPQTINENIVNQPVDRNKNLSEEDFTIPEDFMGDDLVLDNHLTGSPSAPTIPNTDKEASKPEAAAEPAPQSKIINFLDDRDELQLSLRIDHIYYIESAENYVHIYYRNKENIERFTLRSSMKKQQEKLEHHGFIRCHRSYLVNFANILLLRKDKDGPYLDFGESGLKPIPISRTYLDAVTAYFINNSEE